MHSDQQNYTANRRYATCMSYKNVLHARAMHGDKRTFFNKKSAQTSIARIAYHSQAPKRLERGLLRCGNKAHACANTMNMFSANTAWPTTVKLCKLQSKIMVHVALLHANAHLMRHAHAHEQ